MSTIFLENIDLLRYAQLCAASMQAGGTMQRRVYFFSCTEGRKPLRILAQRYKCSGLSGSLKINRKKADTELILLLCINTRIDLPAIASGNHDFFEDFQIIQRLARTQRNCR